ncbi:MAG: Asp-tRNA(Asn)/Glu-tRNA(Gln) amidotransferase subunit GatB [Candidatus Paraimprobicoccus trichonymphae]|uniref:Aspartyl/glutamyl-tRNA(Asn/Gln) amidotransferase subunit B n=1 Tax=Candidatus Paraimprobicoccus trichonymphae TaxID=3033793 RepID=A0AA48L056_9FIRM|nr:MAG: Asp-tRNA(Asn)/Glu-tRNA(Gln) amidotransferase subunit GatB [Candidatus Paraimprobicoccus trichonymphae]
MSYELTIGFETHVELSTKTKIFCSCSSEFGANANSHCCPICIGLPGTLPKLNKQAVIFAIKAGLVTNCKINNTSKFDRKNYVYPDLSKAYQISQFNVPICQNGYIKLSGGKKIRINRIHLEEDAGKLIHKPGSLYVDYNRAGVPLIEIVSEPDISSVEEGKEYIEKIQSLMRYIEISDCKMQEGSMRCDVNISVKKSTDTELGTRTEIKNMNSVNFISKAIEYERKRQIDVLEKNRKIEQETLRYLEDLNITESMRNKENAHDYRYFKEPDLLDVYVPEQEIEKIRSKIPVLPGAKLEKYINELNIPKSDALLITKYKKISAFFEESIINIQNPKLVSNFIISTIFRYLETESEKENFNIKLSAQNLNKLVKLLESKKININLAKSSLVKMLERGQSLEEIISDKDLQDNNLSDEELNKICKEAIEDNKTAVQDYLIGKEKALKFIIGYVMQVTKGKADALKVQDILEILIKSQ